MLLFNRNTLWSESGEEDEDEEVVFLLEELADETEKSWGEVEQLTSENITMLHFVENALFRVRGGY